MSRKSRFKIGFFSLVTVAVAIVLYIAARNVLHPPDSIPEDQITSIHRGELDLSVVATGSVVPETIVKLKSKASGLVKKILVEEGAKVEEGQVLIELDRELLTAQVREGEANLSAARARLQEAQADASSARTMKLKLESDMKNQEDKQKFLGKQARRFNEMFSQQIIAQSQLDERQRALNEATFTLQSIKSELLMQDAKIKAADKAVARVRAEVIQAEASLDRARENLRYATVRAPITGTVLKRDVEVGDAVSSILQLGSQATQMMTLGDMSKVFVEGRVDESDIGKVYLGQKARVRVDAYRDRTFEGTVTQIAPLGEKKDNVIGFNVKVSVNDPDRILRAEMSANAEIIVKQKKDVLIIPENAVIYDKQRHTFAEVYDPSTEDHRRRVAITVGISNGTLTEVASGLKDGDKVINHSESGLL